MYDKSQSLPDLGITRSLPDLFQILNALKALP